MVLCLGPDVNYVRPFSDSANAVIATGVYDIFPVVGWDLF